MDAASGARGALFGGHAAIGAWAGPGGFAAFAVGGPGSGGGGFSASSVERAARAPMDAAAHPGRLGGE